MLRKQSHPFAEAPNAKYFREHLGEFLPANERFFLKSRGGVKY